MIGCCNEHEDEKQGCWGKDSEHKSLPKCKKNIILQLVVALKASERFDQRRYKENPNMIGTDRST